MTIKFPARIQDVCAEISGTCNAFNCNLSFLLCLCRSWLFCASIQQLCVLQTGAGKTHTMMGPSIEDREMAGIVPRVCDHIFSFAAEADESVEFTVQVSFVEIYLERIRDLLDSSKDNLQVGEDPAQGGVYIKGVTEVYATCVEDMMSIMEQGNSTRAVAATGMNEGSSRSHSIFIVALTQKDTQAGVTKTGRLYLCDLAGSETINKTGATGQRLKEATKINQSLSALGNVINSLTDGKSKHIPYRDSKLTRVLQESIGGNSRTSLIINASPAGYNEQETLSTLRFGKRAKNIRNKATVNKARTPEEMERYIRMLEAQVGDLKAREEHWMAAVTGQDTELHADCKAALATAGQATDMAVSSGLAAEAASTARDPSSRASSAAAGDDGGDKVESTAALGAKIAALSGLLTEAGQELQSGRQRLEAAQKRAVAAEADAKSSSAKSSALITRLQVVEDSLTQARSAEAAATGELDAAHSASADLKAEVASISSRNAALNEHIASLKSDKAALVSENASLEQQHKSFVSDHVARIEARVAARKGDQSGSVGKPSVGRASSSSSADSPSRKTAAADAAAGDWVDEDDGNASLASAASGEVSSSMRRALAEARSEVEDLAASVKSGTERSDELSVRVGALDEELSASKASLVVLAAEKAGVQATAQALGEDLEALRSTHSATRQENGALRESVSELRTALAHVEETVHVARERQLLADAAAAVADGRLALSGDAVEGVSVPATPVAQGDASQRELLGQQEDAFEVDTVLESVWANERHFPLGGWASNMLPTDPPAWCRSVDIDGEAGERPALWGAECERSAVVLPHSDTTAEGESAASSGWYWLGPWRVDMDGATDDQGWQYAGDFDDLFRDDGLSGRRSQNGAQVGASSSDLGTWRGTRSPEDSVRRRLWVRQRVQLVLDAPHAPGLGEVVTYLLQATATAPGASEGSAAAAAARARRLVQEFESKTARQLLLMQARLVESTSTAAALSGELRRKNVMVQQYEQRIGEILQKMADAASTGNLSHIGARSQPVRVVRGGGGKGSAQPVRSISGGGGRTSRGVTGFFQSLFSSPSRSSKRPPAGAGGGGGAAPPPIPDQSKGAPWSPGSASDDTAANRRSSWLPWSGGFSSSGGVEEAPPDAHVAVADTRLLEAASKGDVAVLQTVLAEKPGLLDGRDSHGRTAMVYAARAGHVDAMRALEGAGAALQLADTEGRTAMQFAARKGRAEAVQWLLEKGLSVNNADSHALSPLHQATLGRSAEVCKMLVDQGARLDAQDTNGRTPLALARRFSAGATSEGETEAWAAVMSVLNEATQLPSASPSSPSRDELRGASATGSID
jgi:kinesin family protein 5